MNDALTNELERRVDEVLFYFWDPFGLKDEPYARTEYRSYVQEVYRYLQNNKSAEEMARLLIDIVENRMGISINHDLAENVGKLLLRHKKAVESGIS